MRRNPTADPDLIANTARGENRGSTTTGSHPAAVRMSGV
jgi:hypothetical protein